MAARTRRTAPAQPVEDVLDDDVFEDLDETPADDLEDLAEEPAPAPTKRRGRPAKTATETKPKSAPAEKASTGSGFDSNWLAEHVSDATGKNYDSRAIRMLLRKAAAAGILEREVGETRTRYDFPKGANDPTVKAIVKMAKEGAVEKTRAEGLEKAKATRAARKAAPAPVEEDVVEEAPAPRRTRATKTATKAAPAKAAPTTRRRRAAA